MPSDLRSSPSLHGLAGALAGREFRIPSSILIGRDASQCGIVLENAAVSPSSFPRYASGEATSTCSRCTASPHFAREDGRPVRVVAEEVFSVLHRHPWPGNVRQLRNAAERAVVMAEGEVLLPQHLPAEILHPSQPPSPIGSAAGAPEPLLTLEAMAQRMIRRALHEAGNDVKAAVARLGIHPNTLRRKLAHHAVEQS